MKHKLMPLLAAAIIALTGCSDSQKPPIEVDYSPMTEKTTTAQSTTNTTTPTTTTTTTNTTTAATPAVTEPVEFDENTAESPETEEPVDIQKEFADFYSEVKDKFYLAEEDKSFTERSLFVGDSICLGFKAYKRVPEGSVAATGSLGSRSFFDYTFSLNEEDGLSYEQVLEKSKPAFILLSMGMNDVNMVDEDVYCKNYGKIIDLSLKNSNADIFVAAITPICSEYTSNSRIDKFNKTLKAYIGDNYNTRVHFIDYGQYLKNDKNELRACLHSGDGVHLAPYCYDIALWEIHDKLKTYGLLERLNEPVEEQIIHSAEETAEIIHPTEETLETAEHNS